MIDNQLTSVVNQLVTGNADAAEHLMNAYGPEIRRFIRFRMRDSVLRRLHDSVDVEQSVFRRFFRRFSSGDLMLASDDELRAYLFTLVKHRISEMKREQLAQKRKANFVEEDSTFQLGQLPGENDSADTALAESELLMEVRSLVGPEDWQAVIRRLEGRTWKEVAQGQGTLPDTLRKRIQTALQLLKSRLIGTE